MTCAFVKVHYILSELCMGGMVLETNMSEILTRVDEQNKLEKQEVCIVRTACCTALYRNLQSTFT